MKKYEKIGYEVAKGVTKYLCSALIVTLLFWFLLCCFDFGTDETDANGFKRSGLRLYTDYGTGKQYLGDGNGGFIERVKP